MFSGVSLAVPSFANWGSRLTLQDFVFLLRSGVQEDGHGHDTITVLGFSTVMFNRVLRRSQNHPVPEKKHRQCWYHDCGLHHYFYREPGHVVSLDLTVDF